jgi:indole-3-glycerol phosphate synthase
VTLARILAAKRREVEVRRQATSTTDLRGAPLWAAPRRGFHAALHAREAPAVIAELKRASPSRGRIREEFDPAALARGYARAGAAALSVLTDEPFFEGALEHLARARGAVELPCLRKDFLVDPYQVEEARAWGADAVLLIVAAVSGTQGHELLAAAAAAGLDVLVEVHTAPELEWACDVGARLIGVNNRDLATFAVRLETTERLLAAARPRLPPGTVVVAESGIRSRRDVDRMTAAGAHAVLVGEAFMERADPGAALAEWLACR